MPKSLMKSKSRKGKISGSARKEINASRVSKILEQGEGYLFARVVKHLGMGRVEVNIATPRGAVKTLRAQIPLVFSRKGATPINSTTVVSIFAGKDFDSEKEIDPKIHFKIEAILKDSEADHLKGEGKIPAWMTARVLSTEGVTTATAKAAEEEGWEFAREDSESEADADADAEEAESEKKDARASKHVEMADFEWE